MSKIKCSRLDCKFNDECNICQRDELNFRVCHIPSSIAVGQSDTYLICDQFIERDDEEWKQLTKLVEEVLFNGK